MYFFSLSYVLILVVSKTGAIFHICRSCILNTHNYAEMTKVKVLFRKLYHLMNRTCFYIRSHVVYSLHTQSIRLEDFIVILKHSLEKYNKIFKTCALWDTWIIRLKRIQYDLMGGGCNIIYCCRMKSQSGLTT